MYTQIITIFGSSCFIVFSFRDLGSGRGGTIPIKGDLPAIPSTEPWDGKDGEVIKLTCLKDGRLMCSY